VTTINLLEINIKHKLLSLIVRVLSVLCSDALANIRVMTLSEAHLHVGAI